MSEETLEPLITQCPNCDTRFRVTEAQLQVARGRVRCGACLTVFDGTSRLSLDGEPLGESGDAADVDALLEELNELGERDSSDFEEAQAPAQERAQLPEALLALEAELIEDLHRVDRQPAPAEPDEALPETEQSADEVVPAAPDIDEEIAAGSAQHDDVGTEQQAPLAADLEPPLALNLAPDVLFPDLDEPDDKPARLSPATLVLILLAVIALPAQVLWFQYEAWVMDPNYRPMYATLCSITGCELPPMRDVSKIASKKSIIRAHPDRDDARIVDVLMVNNAEFPQPFPLIELMATSLRGQLVAGRRFKPAEYLQGEIAQVELFPPNTPVHVSLEIQDPGDQALNFEVRFR